MASRRAQRVAKLLAQEAAMLLLGDLKDPGLPSIEITGARVSEDLQVAHVYWVAIDGERDQAERALQRAEKFLRREISSRLNLRRAPQIRFHYDESTVRGQQIETLLHELRTSGQMGDDEASSAPAPPESDEGLDDDDGNDRDDA